MVLSESIIPATVLDEFKTCARLQFNGKLDIHSCKGYKFSFYYRLGRIVWATGAAHPFRRWKRQMSQYCPEININTIQLRASDTTVEHWGYTVLETLCKTQKINRQQVISIVDSTISELLFDLAQQTNCTTLVCHRNQEVILDAPMSLTSADLSLRQMYNSWHSWCEAGLASFSPDWAPILRQPEQLESLVSASAYANFVKVMQGKYTLRDLAVRMKQDVLTVSRSLLPYILRGIVELIEVEDSLSQHLIKEHFNSDQKTLAKPQLIKTLSKAPLIACIDDSPQVCMLMEKITVANSMNFVGIQDYFNILPILIERKPDFIFLDLIMPVTNGYEVCSQIRRVSVLANVPVVILTGSDGIFDRIRAKVAGSTDFITKPVVEDKIINMVHKHLPVVNSSAQNSGMAPFLEMSYVS
ncbi:response regulator receiver protein [Calothrix sp. NIES-4071]|nr:response regulator receiver protein [Calothrix sp. NIES-4071]BAZ59965.1 response regulator receiver protein [Calothrix sp. NIES-4105]